MKIIKYELLKYTNHKLIWLIIAFLIVCNIFIASKQSVSKPSEEFLYYYNELQNEFENDPEKTLKKIEEVFLEIERISKANEELIASGTDFSEKDILIYQNKYTPDTVGDRYLFNNFIMIINQDQKYTKDINSVINLADRLHTGMELSDSDMYSFSAKYQRAVIDIYSEQVQANIQFSNDYKCGWGEYFSYNGDTVFLLFAFLICSAMFIIPEYGKMLPILKSTKNGRYVTIYSKMVSAFIVSAFIVILFSLSTFIVFAVRGGFSNGTQPIQSFLTYSSWNVSLIGGLFIKVIVKIIIGYTFVCFGIILSCLFYDYISVFTLGGVLVGVNYIIAHLDIINNNSPLKHLNLFTALSGNAYIEKWNGINFFNKYCLDYTSLLPLFYLLLTVIFIVFSIIIFSKFHVVSTKNRIKIISQQFNTYILKKLNLLKINKPRSKTKFCSENLLKFELYKMLFQPTTLIILIFIALSINNSVSYFKPIVTYKDKTYKDYMNVLSGEWTIEKSDYIQTENNNINSVLSIKDQMDQKYKNEEITIIEYRTYIIEYNKLKQKAEVFELVYQQEQYIKSCQSNGIKAYFVYDTGWVKYFDKGADYLTASVIIIATATIFSSEYSKGFINILQCTKKGRTKTFFMKFLSSVTISIFIMSVIFAFDIITVKNNMGLPQLHAPAASTHSFMEYEGSYLKMLIFNTFIKYLAVIILAVISCSLSSLFKKSLPTITVLSLILFVSPMLNLFSFESLNNFMFDNLLNRTTPLINSTANFSIIIFAFTALVLSVVSYKKYMKSGI